MLPGEQQAGDHDPGDDVDDEEAADHVDVTHAVQPLAQVDVRRDEDGERGDDSYGHGVELRSGARTALIWRHEPEVPPVRSGAIGSIRAWTPPAGGRAGPARPERRQEAVAELVHRAPPVRRCSAAGPGVQPQPEMRRSTAGSCAISEIGTSWETPTPLTLLLGWWSPSTIITSFLSWAWWTNETSELQGVLDRVGVVALLVGSAEELEERRVARLHPVVHRAVAELVPRHDVRQGVQGVWLETRSISAISGLCRGRSSSFWANARNVYWSGIRA